MRWLKGITRFLAVGGLVVFLLSIGIAFFLKNTKDGRALAVQWQLTRIFQDHGHEVAWSRVLYESISPYLQKEIQDWSGGEQIRLFVKSRLHTARTALSVLTFIHVLQVVNVPERREPLFLFVFERPFQEGRDDPFKERSYEVTASPLTHQHEPFRYFHAGTAFAWGDLSLFPLEHYFLFEEIERRQSWVDETSRGVSFWGWNLGGPCFLLCCAVLLWFRFPAILVQVPVSLRKISLRWRPAYSLTGVPLDTTGKGDAAPEDIPADSRDAALREKREKIVLVHCIVFLCERAREKEQQAAKAERDALYRKMTALYSAAGPQTQDGIEGLLKQFPRGNNHGDLRRARALLRQVEMIDSDRTPARDSPASVEGITDGHPEAGPEEKDTLLTPPALSMRWLYGLLEDIAPLVTGAGGDPFVVSTILLYGFLRPGYRKFVMGDNFHGASFLHRRVEQKVDDVFLAFGRRILPEEIDKGFRLLEEGGLLLKQQHGKIGTRYSLNSRVRNAKTPEWGEVIRIIMRAAHKIQRAGGKG